MEFRTCTEKEYAGVLEDMENEIAQVLEAIKNLTEKIDNCKVLQLEKEIEEENKKNDANLKKLVELQMQKEEMETRLKADQGGIENNEDLILLVSQEKEAKEKFFSSSKFRLKADLNRMKIYMAARMPIEFKCLVPYQNVDTGEIIFDTDLGKQKKVKLGNGAQLTKLELETLQIIYNISVTACGQLEVVINTHGEILLERPLIKAPKKMCVEISRASPVGCVAYGGVNRFANQEKFFFELHSKGKASIPNYFNKQRHH